MSDTPHELASIPRTAPPPRREVSSADPHPRKRARILDAEMSYVDVGEGDPIVFLHGNPTSSYLWRNIIPYVSGQGRCLAPDLVGMGRSGKSPVNAYRFRDHARRPGEHRVGVLHRGVGRRVNERVVVRQGAPPGPIRMDGSADRLIP